MSKSLWWLAPLALPVLAVASTRRRPPRTLTVHALGQHHALADCAVVELGLEVESPALKDAYVQVQVEAERTRAQLRASGFSPDPVRWGAFTLQRHQGDAGGCRLQVNAEVAIPDLRMLDPLVAALSASAMQPVRSLGFRLRDPALAEEAAVADACRNAQRKALALARDLGAALGELQAVRLGRISGARARFPSLSIAAAPAAFAPPRDLVVTASVTLAYHLCA